MTTTADENLIADALRAIIKRESARRDRLRARMAQGDVWNGKPQRRARALKEAELLVAQASDLLLQIDRGLLDRYYGEGAAGIKGHTVLSAMAREYVENHGTGGAERELIETLGLDVPVMP